MSAPGDGRWVAFVHGADATGTLTALAGVFSTRGVSFDSLSTGDVADGVGLIVVTFTATERRQRLLMRTVRRLASVRAAEVRAADDPALLDELLAMPRAHLLVDGYNVSKLAWPDQPLAEQRRRLTERLANLAGRSGAEVTCCFDGRDAAPADRAPSAPRGVRVLFSQGEIADDLLRRLVRAEPPGRVVLAVTSDRALAADLEAAGARVLPSPALVGRLGRL